MKIVISLVVGILITQCAIVEAGLFSRVKMRREARSMRSCGILGLGCRVSAGPTQKAKAPVQKAQAPVQKLEAPK